MTKLRYNFKNDVLFKVFFVRSQDQLRQLVAAMLKIAIESIERFEVTNVEIPPDVVGDKFCRLDINMIVNGQHVSLEIQVHDEGDFPERLMYYWAREFSSKLQEGKHYIELPRTIIMSIVNFKMFNCAEYYSRFRVLEAIRHTELTDKFEIIICELPKLPSELDIDNKLELWMRLFAAENEEDLQEIEAMEVPEMTQAIQTYRKITVSPEFQALERMREDAKNNEAAALHNAEQRGIQIGEQRGLTLAAINAIHAGITNPMAIAAIAGLSEDQAVALIQEYKRTP